MSDVNEDAAGTFELAPRQPPRRAEIERRAARGLELTPEQKVARRRNRRWMLGIAIPSVIVLVLALIASGVAQSNAPSGPSQAAPVGYKTVNDGYFSYVVPKGWSTNGEMTDQAGDVETSGKSGFAGEHIGYLLEAPTLGEPQPASLRAFGVPRPSPYRLSDGHPVTVRGAAVAFQYTVTRPGGFRAVAVDAWDERAGVELWLLVGAPPAVTATLLSSLEA